MFFSEVILPLNSSTIGDLTEPTPTTPVPIPPEEATDATDGVATEDVATEDVATEDVRSAAASSSTLRTGAEGSSVTPATSDATEPAALVSEPVEAPAVAAAVEFLEESGLFDCHCFYSHVFLIIIVFIVVVVLSRRR